jgi:hypothetical protein
MKLLVCGSRSFSDYETLSYAIDAIPATEIIHGGAFGADSLAHRYAEQRKIPVTVIKPDWDRYGKAAGPMRNRQMVDMCDQVLAFWDAKSRGTKSTIEYARKIGKPLKIMPTKLVPATESQHENP